MDSRESYQDWTYNVGLTWQATEGLSVNFLTSRGFRAPNLNDLGALGLNDLGYEVPASAALEADGLVGTSDGEGVPSSGRSVGALKAERLLNYELGTALRWRGLYTRVHVFDAELKDPIVRRTLVFPIGSAPASLAGVPVAPIAPSIAQVQQGVGSVATALDPHAVKAFVNEGQARYYGLDAQVNYRIASRWSAEASYVPGRPRLEPGASGSSPAPTARLRRGSIPAWRASRVDRSWHPRERGTNRAERR